MAAFFMTPTVPLPSTAATTTTTTGSNNVANFGTLQRSILNDHHHTFFDSTASASAHRELLLSCSGSALPFYNFYDPDQPPSFPEDCCYNLNSLPILPETSFATFDGDDDGSLVFDSYPKRRCHRRRHRHRHRYNFYEEEEDDGLLYSSSSSSAFLHADFFPVLPESLSPPPLTAAAAELLVPPQEDCYCYHERIRPMNSGDDEEGRKMIRRNNNNGEGGWRRREVSAQSIAARERRRRITEKTQELGKVVPGGTKMNTAEMLAAAFKYLNFLHSQLHILRFMSSLHQVLSPSPSSSIFMNIFYSANAFFRMCFFFFFFFF